MTSAPLAASVIVPTHNGAHRLPALLDAFATQDCTDPFEVVVVVDDSTDDTADVLNAYRDRLPLRVLHSPAPHGVVAALNTGFDAAHGRVLIRCDDDLTPGPAMVRRHIAHHAERDDLAVSAAIRDVVPDTPYGRVYGAAAAERRRIQWYARPPELRWVDWSAHNSVTRTLWERLDPGYDARFVYGQDSEHGYRLHQAGARFVVDPDLEIEHRGAARTAANRIPRAYVAGASRALFESVHGSSHAAADSRPTTPSQMLWTLAVRSTARFLTRWTAYERMGRGVEALLPVVPASLARRLVAFAVESAGRAGRVHGPRDLDELRRQRSREQQQERTVSTDLRGRARSTPR